MRDLALMTLHFAVVGREHELAHLRVRDIVEDPEGRGLIVGVWVSKVAPRTVEVPFGSRAHLCPVGAWRRWKTLLAGGLDPVTFGDILTRIGARAHRRESTQSMGSEPASL